MAADDHGLSTFWKKFKTGDVAGLVDLFSSSPHLEDPIEGSIHGEDELRQFVDVISIKMRLRNATWEHIATTSTAERVICEWNTRFDLRPGRWPPPMAAVGDVDNGKFSSIRIYCSSWPQTGNHGIRLPLLPIDDTIVLTGAVGDYQRCIAAGDVQGVLDSFEEDGSRRDSRGGPYEHKGKEQLRGFYKSAFTQGGIPLRHCTVTDDGRSCAIEYILNRWGDRAMPPQAGVGVYVRGNSGRIAAVRVYDDVDPSDRSSRKWHITV